MRHRNFGFTLIDALVALAVTALFTLIIFTAVNGELHRTAHARRLFHKKVEQRDWRSPDLRSENCNAAPAGAGIAVTACKKRHVAPLLLITNGSDPP